MTEPTDAELDELRQANGGKLNFVTFSEFRTIARAALAKWGSQPVVPAGYALVPVEPTPEMLSEIWVHKNGSLSEAYRAMLAAAPQPVVREPLTDGQIEKLREATFSTSNPFCPCDSKTMRKAVRAAEAAHGIKQGGQHGAEH